MRCICSLFFLLMAPSAVSQDLNIALMQSTFMLQGTAPGGAPTLGTGFLLVRPHGGQNPTSTGQIVLVTAAHVLEGMAGDEARILLRSQAPGTGMWSVVPAHFKIRRNGQVLWKKHPTADVAVMYVRWPFEITQSLASTEMLPDDAALQKYGVGPGLGLKSLGYPLGNASNEAGFPILRTGVVASYPLLPTAETKTFLFDFRVFKGNSGGPVYYAEATVKGSAGICCLPQFLMGLVSEERVLPVSSTDLYESRVTQYPLSLGVVVHASIVRATIESLPLPGTPDAISEVVPIELLLPLR